MPDDRQARVTYIKAYEDSHVDKEQRSAAITISPRPDRLTGQDLPCANQSPKYIA